MVSIEDVETRLSSLFEQVAVMVETDPGSAREEQVRASINGMEEHEPLRGPLRIRRWVAAALAGPVALALSTTVAAAAPGNPPTLTEIMGAAKVLLSSPAVIEQSAAQMRISVAGPEGARFEVFTMPIGYGNRVAGSCTRLAAIPAGGQSQSVPLLTGEMACTLIGSHGPTELSSQQISQARAGGGQAVAQWTSPSGTDYEVVYGEAEGGTASVALANGIGVKGASAAAVGGWFVVYLPKSKVASYPYLKFYRQDGSLLDTLPGKF